MNKKYIILNSDNQNNSTIFYLFYIVIIFATLSLFVNLFSYGRQENFADSTTKDNNKILTELETKNKELTLIKTTLENKLKEQSRATYLSSNFNKVDESSFTDEMDFLDIYFENTDLPQIDLNKYTIVTTQNDLDNKIKQASKFVNLYKAGDIVTENSSFNIDKKKICYPDANGNITIDQDFLKTYPDCMACSINDDYKDTKSWTNTRTNIDKVCLFNQTAAENSGITTMTDCKNLCKIK